MTGTCAQYLAPRWGHRILSACLALFAWLPGEAVAAPEWLASCRDLPETARAGQVVDVPSAGRVVHVVDGSKRWFAVERDGECDVYPVGRAALRVNAAVLPNAGKSKAFVLLPSVCTGESCAPLLVVRSLSAPARMLAAVQVPTNCEYPVSLVATQVFGGPSSSLELTCESGAGAAAYNRDVTLAHAHGELIDVVYHGHVGFRSESSPNEDEESGEHCAFVSMGYLRVVKRGDAPTLVHLNPAAEGRELTTLVWAAGAFEASAAAPATVETVKTCKPLKRRR